MAAKLSEGLGEQVTCPICLEHYSDPRLLPCLHTYCRQCLQDLLAKGERKVSVVCPECREEVPVISGDVTKLKVNFWINNLLSLLSIYSTEEKDGGKTEVTCENCDSKAAAKGRCVNCSVFLCNVCFTAHQHLQALKDHQLITMDEMKNTGIPVIEKRLFCEKHKGEVKKLFCNTCKELICRDCAIIDHRDHHFNFVDKDLIDQHKQLFKTELDRARNTKDEIEGVLKLVQKIKGNVEETSKDTEKDIDDFVNRQIRDLGEKRASLKEKTKKISATKMKELTAQEDVLVMHVSGLKSAIEFTEKMLTNGSNSDVLSVSKQLTSRLSQLSESTFPENLCYPWQKKKPIFVANEKLFRESLGCINVEEVYIVDHNKCSIAQRIGGCLVNTSQDLIAAQPGQVLKFVVQIKNSFDKKLKIMVNRIQVKVSYLDETESTLPVKSLKDDTYSFKVTYKMWPLLVSIQVLVDGKNILGSPINFK